MPSYFLDSNAVVKRYHYERGSGWVPATCGPRTRPHPYISQLAEVETVASLRRIGRISGVHVATIDTFVNMFQRHIGRDEYNVIAISPQIIQFAQALCNQFWEIQPHPLRAMDAIQIATAQVVAAIADDLLFVSSDRRQLAVAKELGLAVVDPEHA